MKNIIKFRKLFVVLFSLISILLLSSCTETLREKEELGQRTDIHNALDDQIEEIADLGNKEIIKLASIAGNKVVFEYMNLQKAYDVESSIDFFMQGNKSKFSSIFYGAIENGEIYYDIKELPSKQLELSLVNSKSISHEVDISNLTKSIYCNETEHEILDDIELVLGVIIFSLNENSIEQIDKIIYGNDCFEEFISIEDYVFILKSKFKSCDKKK